MSLFDKIQRDNHLVYQRKDQMASDHTWNGIPFTTVPDEETALKRKNNNVVDISWDNNTTETILYVCKEDFPGRAEPNQHGFLDGKSVKILQVNEDMGMLTILFTANVAKVVSG